MNTSKNLSVPEHDERCRQLAELIEPAFEGADGKGHPDMPDPRFAALRGEHDRLLDWDDREGYTRCVHCRRDDVPFDSYCLRTDADALLECAAACGLSILLFKVDGEWHAELHWDSRTKGFNVRSLHARYGHGATVAEAISAALWQAVVGGE